MANYKVFYIPKGNGYRKIVTYEDTAKELREYHKNSNKILYERITQSDFAKAYRKGYSIADNARAHLYSDVFISIDIKDFFQSISHSKLLEIVEYEANKNERSMVSKTDIKDLISSCSIAKRGLAVGMIPSPLLANIYLKTFDGIVYGQIKKMGLKKPIYTRYADDITISFNIDKEESKGIGDIKDEILRILNKQLHRIGLSLNNRKTRVINLYISNHVRITGLNIVKNDDNYRSISVGRKRKNILYHSALELYDKKERNEEWIREVKRIRGVQSFVLSIEGPDYENSYSKEMLQAVMDRGYNSLKELIDNFRW